MLSSPPSLCCPARRGRARRGLGQHKLGGLDSMNQRKAGAVERQRVAGAHEGVLAVAFLSDRDRAFQTWHPQARGGASIEDFTCCKGPFAAAEIEVARDPCRNSAPDYAPACRT